MSEQSRRAASGLWAKRWLPVLLAGAVLVTALLAWALPRSGQAAQLQERREQVTALQSELAGVEQEVVDNRAESVIGATGQDVVGRQGVDDAVINDLMRTAVTWSSGREYMQAREDVLRRFGLDEGSPFMVQYMPGEEQGAFRTDPQGNVHFAFPDANSRLVSLESTLVEIDGPRWSYFAVVRTATSSAGGAEVTSWSTMTYTIDEEGNVLDVMAYPGNQPPQTSQG